MGNLTEQDKEHQYRGWGKLGDGVEYAEIDPDGSLRASARFNDSASIDAFARLRVSNPITLFDSKQIFDNQPLFWDDSEVSGSGTSSTYSQDNARTRLSVSASTAGNRQRQTFQRFNYQPGKSMLVLCTGVLGAQESGITQTIGYYDDDNGLMFSCIDGVMNVTRRTSVTGSAVDTSVAQSSWNLDTMDGNGISGVTLDYTKTQIFLIDFEWLGVGRVRYGFVVDGIPVYCHEINNANTLTEVYISNPNLPIRYEIDNDGTGVSTFVDHICSTVISEGGSQDLGVLRYASTDGTHVDADTENTQYALMGIRLKSANTNAVIKLVNFSIQIHTATDKIQWKLLLNPTVAGTFTYSDETNSSVQIATGALANTVTSGTEISGGFLESGGAQAGAAGSLSGSIDNAILLGSKIDGTVDEFVLIAMPIAGSTNVDLEAGINWREIS